ncbi:MAG: 3-oxoacyl-ACP synthase III family protein [Clostridium sp.]|uniref:ketoacyl-ACP synthase III n=1 Tax=Clostridium sp. TaxID=1506 RepID=UPI0025B8B37D|nr:3-oxoacyl-ACP synthase III family protein [Clostridium sp.]MCH3963609.1 3-oxoacyl-ACP synthase III family protein [Clostridium sp.]MCI1714750.1 3-oxoacyl-ACP synthase III family protein [Clostridium sp.]MCI1799061.1 3-oxoacyl-ACP synthase III family protein [Clostridium sp.]MCI1812933.1 3-oxoacyl-ACP synthase III family protein [Clostridium sp.]MCI1869823.1 3-oxoacyl-ACP synthase III family protein [Clostridium sp.]
MYNHNAVIRGIEYYHPKNKVDNKFFIDHFNEQGKNIDDLLKTTGRNTRYISKDFNETVVTMGVKAAKKVLDSTNINPSELNLIIFSSGTPEYLSPSNALEIHELIQAGQKCAVYDLNANCVGMIVALEQASRIFRDNINIKYALVIGSDQLNKYSRFDEAITYSNFGDSACAIILENISNTNAGFIDSDFYTNSRNYDKILLPAKGLTLTIHDKRLNIKDKLVKWIPFNFDGAFHSAKISIEEVLTRNNLQKKDIKKYFVSQFAKKSIEQICDDLNEDIKKFTFVGDKFGYTGTTSPFLAFSTSIEKKEINKDDYIIFWSVGAGTTCSCVLYKY